MKQSNRTFRIPTLLLLTSALFILGSCQRSAEKTEPVFAVNVMPVSLGEIKDYIEINGDVETLTSIDVFADKSGEVIGINVLLGQYIGAGQTIALVDPSRPGQRFNPNAVTAPISGTIVALPVQIGATVGLTTPIAKIARTNELVLTTEVAERFIGRIRIGLPAEARFEAFPNEVFTARVTELSPVVDPATRTLPVKLFFTGNSGRVKPGMFGEIKIITAQKENIVKIPSNAVIRRNDEVFLFVVRDNNTAEKRIVTSGIEIDDQVEIVTGLGAGEQLVVMGQRSIEDNAKVKIVDRITPLQAVQKR